MLLNLDWLAESKSNLQKPTLIAIFKVNCHIKETFYMFWTVVNDNYSNQG